MLLPLTYPELQEKFSEGFDFQPIRGLKQHNTMIYKCYGYPANIIPVLDFYNHEQDFNGLYTSMILLKLRQGDIPIAEQLMGQLHTATGALEQHFSTLKKLSDINRQLLNILTVYQSILLAYKRDVQDYIAMRISSPPTSEDETLSFKNMSTADIRQVQVIILKFCNSTNMLFIFLKNCIEKKPGFENLFLMKEELLLVSELLETSALFRDQQQKTISIIRNWRKHRLTFTKQQMRN